MQDFVDRPGITLSGYTALGVWVVLSIVVLPFLSLPTIDATVPEATLIAISEIVLAAVVLPGLYVVQPNTAAVLTLLGAYAGTDQKHGLRWTVPYLIIRKRVSQRLRNFETTRSKVNDATGNPIEIAGIVVWRTKHPAASVFGVDDVAHYVSKQVEAAMRALASAHPYGSARNKADGTLTLQGNPNEIAQNLAENVQDRVSDAGVEIIEARLSHLAYAPEIAAAMLQRQQADALVDAREVIGEGAVGLVDTALQLLKEKNVVEFKDSEKAALASNLMVVLSGDQSAQPVIAAGAYRGSD